MELNLKPGDDTQPYKPKTKNSIMDKIITEFFL